MPALHEPLRFELITGGLSNLTYRVTDAEGRRWVLRRPPLGHVLATAHDMGREHTIISALGPTPVPVPPVVGLCTDDAVNGAPFFVMDFVDGRVVRDVEQARMLAPEARAAAGRNLIDVLADIHAVDVDAVGVGDLGRREAYLERQLRRWNRQWEATRTDDLPLVDEVHDRLVAAIPDQGPATIVHGDYRLDNCLLGEDGSVRAVLDWELCTLGDPLADVGLMLDYWVEPGSAPAPGLPTATTLEGFASKAELLDRYAERSGRDVSMMGYYQAFGYWKLACILQGVIVRYAAGAMGEAGNARARRLAGADPRRGGPRRARRPGLRSPRCRARSTAGPRRGSVERMSPLFELLERPELESPVLVLGLDGWIDAGLAAATALGTVLEDLETATVATFDTDVLLDHRSRRPVMHLEDGVATGLTWPTLELRAGADRFGNDLLFLTGAEPDHQWRAFSRVVVDLAGRVRGPPGPRARRLPGPGPPHPTHAARLHGDHARAGPAGSAWSAAASTSPPASTPPSSDAAPTRGCRPWGCGPRCPTTRPPCPTRPAPPPWSPGSSGIGGLPPAGRAPSTRTPGPPGSASTAWWPTARSTSRWCASSRPSSTPSRRSPTRARSPPATTWPPSSSGSCATRTDAAGPGGPTPTTLTSWGGRAMTLRGGAPSRWAWTFSLASARRLGLGGVDAGGHLEAVADLAVDLHHHRHGLDGELGRVGHGPGLLVDVPAAAPLPQLGGDVRRHRRHAAAAACRRRASRVCRRGALGPCT